jgi:GDP-L-fucose synthase
LSNIDIETKRILVTGGAGFLGKFVIEELLVNGALKENIVIPRSSKNDLRNFDNCNRLLKDIDLVIHLAARVGGIGFNMKYPGALFYDNAIMGINIVEASRINNIEKVVLVGTVCSYPKFTPTPFREEALWDGYPEETNAPYGVAKKALLVQAQSYRAQYGMDIIYLIPVNLYGPGDHFDLENSHVIPALIRKFVEAKERNDKEVVVWGTGNVSREFLYVEDAAMGIVSATLKYNKPDPVNLGTGQEIMIKDLVELIRDMIGFEGKLAWDNSKPDGQPRRMLDTSMAEKEFGFNFKTSFETGLKNTINWYLKNPE